MRGSGPAGRSRLRRSPDLRNGIFESNDERDAASLEVFTEALERVGVPLSDRGSVHCELRYGNYALGESTSLALSALTFTAFPGWTGGTSLLVAKVVGPGRAPAEYRFEWRTSTWVWAPLLPVLLVQASDLGWQEAKSAAGRVHLARALDYALVEDGWL